MKHVAEFSDEAVNKRSMQAARELAVATRSTKVKRELDNARMDKKERRPLKEFTEFRTEITEHVGVPAHSMPPNILILRRKTIRQFPNNVMVALYFNDKLNQYFSIPYGGVEADETVITPVALKEAEQCLNKSQSTAEGSQHSRGHLNEWEEGSKHKIGDMVSYGIPTSHVFKRGKITKLGADHVIVHRKEPHGGKYGYHYKVPHDAIVHNERLSTERVDSLNEDAISHLKKVVAFKTSTPLYHKDGTQTKIDPQTANALLTVHKSLHPDNQKKFADALEYSKPQFARMLDFAWKQVR